ncbi:hypothetical protein EI200_11370 [Peribacillus simplex]|nr:hypothetical protein EI200_11370 [Peribacillus simplex]
MVFSHSVDKYENFSKREVLGIPRLAVIAIIIQYLIGSYVYRTAHLPYIIYPNVTILSGFTDPTSFRAVFATYFVGFAWCQVSIISGPSS